MRFALRLLIVAGGMLVSLASSTTTASSSASRADIQSITVSVANHETAALRTLQFTIRFARPVALGSGTKLQIMLDTDRNPNTGIQGAEYALDYSGEPPSPRMLMAVNGEAIPLTMPSPRFWSDARTATFQISSLLIKVPFDFWVFIEQNGHRVDEAPTHVLFSSDAAPWTYPKNGSATATAAYPTETYDDSSDTSLTANGRLIIIVLASLIGTGAVLGTSGYLYNKHKNPPNHTPSTTP